MSRGPVTQFTDNGVRIGTLAYEDAVVVSSEAALSVRAGKSSLTGQRMGGSGWWIEPALVRFWSIDDVKLARMHLCIL